MDVQAQLLDLSAARRHGRWDEALALAEAILEVAPDRFPAIEARALALSALGRSAEALAAYDHAVGIAEKRLQKGLPAQELVVSMRMARARELASAGREAEAIADLKMAIQLDPKCRTQLKKERARFSRILESEGGAELLSAKKVRTAGFVIELTTRVDDELVRSQFFSLGNVDEVIAVLAAEFGISRADEGQRAAAAEAALTLDQTLVAYVVRGAEAGDPIDLHSFLEVFWRDAWHRLDADDVSPLREQTFEQLRALGLSFRVDEASLRAALPVHRAPLRRGELLQVDAFAAFDGEDKLLQHGVHDLVDETFNQLPEESTAV